MRNQDLIARRAEDAASSPRFRNTLGLPGTPRRRGCSPTIPTDDPRGIAASILDGLLLRLPATPSSASIPPPTASRPSPTLLQLIDDCPRPLRDPDPVLRPGPRHHARCARIEQGAPVDLVFQSIAGTEAANRSLRRRPRAAATRPTTAALSLAARHASATTSCISRPARARALSANAHHGVDQQTLRGPRLRRRARVLAAAGQHRRRLHRPGISLRRQADHPRRPRGPLLRQAARPAHGLRRLLHQPRRGRPGRHGRAADPARRRRRQLHHGRARAPTTSCSTTRPPRSTTRSTCAQALGLRPAPEFEAWLDRIGLAAGTPEAIPARLTPALAGLS